MNAATAPAIEIDGLRKTYRGRRARMAVDGLDIMVEPGEVHGFLGPNGSGKTTTLRALLGLVRADSGSMRIFGRRVPAALPNVIGAVGAVVESPQFFGNFTGRRTLRLLATAGGIKRKRVDEVLETVGLRDRARERVKSYSLGMKQRLAIASALLKSPRLLVLDEPANGLDPAGIREIRDLLRTLGATGMTVLLSSHILSEVQQVCDTVTIVSRGRRVVAGPVTDVLSQFDKGDVRVRVPQLDAAARLIADTGLPVRVYGDYMIVSDLADPAWISETLAKRRMYVSELTPLLPDLENVFLNLTGTMPEPGVRRQVDDAYRPPNQQPLRIMEPVPPPEELVSRLVVPLQEQVPAEPVTAEPVTAEPVTAEPAPVVPPAETSDPLLTQPAASDPAVTLSAPDPAERLPTPASAEAAPGAVETLPTPDGAETLPALDGVERLPAASQATGEPVGHTSLEPPEPPVEATTSVDASRTDTVEEDEPDATRETEPDTVRYGEPDTAREAVTPLDGEPTGDTAPPADREPVGDFVSPESAGDVVAPVDSESAGEAFTPVDRGADGNVDEGADGDVDEDQDGGAGVDGGAARSGERAGERERESEESR